LADWWILPDEALRIQFISGPLAFGVMFDAPDNASIAHVKITRQVVCGESQPIIRRKQDAEAA